MKRPSFFYTLLLGLSASSLSLSSAFAATWEEKFYNPKPQKDDIILPMPCEGKMAFRIVSTKTPKPLDEQNIVLGDDASEEGFVSHSIPGYIAGSFQEKSARYFLMAKYEVSQSQYEAVMNPQCPSSLSALPVVNISWFDALDFTRRYNTWIAQNAPKEILTVDGEKGFFRLPTNAEWEFAARGGNAVTAEEFREPIFPLNGNELFLYASFAGASSSNNKLQAIGKPDYPNPLGLFDMLGNAREIMLDPFQLNKLDRYHGQTGGVTVRGGSFRTPEELLTSYLKDERPFFTESGEADKTSDMGFRIVMSSNVLTPTNFKKISQEWPSLLNSTTKTESQQAKVNDQLNQLRSSVQDNKIKTELEEIKKNLAESKKKQEAQRDTAIRENLQLGAFLCRDIKLKKDFLDDVTQAFLYDQQYCTKENKEEACSPAQLKNRKEQTLDAKKSLDTRLTYYSDAIVSAITNYDIAAIEPQLAATTLLENYRQVYWNHIKHYKKRGKNAQKQYLQDCITASE